MVVRWPLASNLSAFFPRPALHDSGQPVGDSASRRRNKTRRPGTRQMLQEYHFLFPLLSFSHISSTFTIFPCIFGRNGASRHLHSPIKCHTPLLFIILIISCQLTFRLAFGTGHVGLPSSTVIVLRPDATSSARLKRGGPVPLVNSVEPDTRERQEN